MLNDSTASRADFPTPVITCTICHSGHFLLVKRPDSEEQYSSKWAFPGGRIEHGENAIEALRREVLEETGLLLTDRFMFLNSYVYPGAVGLHFVVEAQDRNIRSSEFAEYHWIGSLSEMQRFDRIAGIDNHIEQYLDRRDRAGAWFSLDGASLTADKYLNA